MYVRKVTMAEKKRVHFGWKRWRPKYEDYKTYIRGFYNIFYLN